MNKIISKPQFRFGGFKSDLRNDSTFVEWERAKNIGGLNGDYLEDCVFKILSFVKNQSGGEFFLFSRESLARSGGVESNDKLDEILERLAKTKYIDKKYSDEEYALIKPLEKSYLASEDESRDTPFASFEKERSFWRFFIPFLGAFSGVLLGLTIFAALC